jgi:hypothetical protein
MLARNELGDGDAIGPIKKDTPRRWSGSDLLFLNTIILVIGFIKR